MNVIVGRGIEVFINPWFIALVMVNLLSFPIPTVCVLAALVMHEAGHLLTARLCGFMRIRIVLFPFGGQADVAGMVGTRPGIESVVVLAGPLVNLFLGWLIYIIYGTFKLTWLPPLFYANLFLGALNLIPVLPLDGGRLLVFYLSRFLGFKKAVGILASLGALLGSGIIIIGLGWGLGLMPTVNLVAIGVFLLYKACDIKEKLPFCLTLFVLEKASQLRQGQMVRCCLLLAKSSVTVRELVKEIVPSRCLVVLVLWEGRLKGIITEGEIIEAYLEKGPSVTLEKLLRSRGYEEL